MNWRQKMVSAINAFSGEPLLDIEVERIGHALFDLPLETFSPARSMECGS